MADSKVTQLPYLTTPQSEDLLYIIDNPQGTPTSKKIDLKTLFGNITSNTVINQRLNVSGNTTLTVLTSNTLTITNDNIVIQDKVTPSSSVDNTYAIGSFVWDENYLYIKVNVNTFKRIPLQSF